MRSFQILITIWIVIRIYRVSKYDSFSLHSVIFSYSFCWPIQHHSSFSAVLYMRWQLMLSSRRWYIERNLSYTFSRSYSWIHESYLSFLIGIMIIIIVMSLDWRCTSGVNNSVPRSHVIFVYKNPRTQVQDASLWISDQRGPRGLPKEYWLVLLLLVAYQSKSVRCYFWRYPIHHIWLRNPIVVMLETPSLWTLWVLCRLLKEKVANDFI